MERPAWAPRGIDISVPSVSRIYDFYLGGSHNFEVDREAARRALEFMPGLPKIMQANRAFMRRAVRFAPRRFNTRCCSLWPQSTSCFAGLIREAQLRFFWPGLRSG